MTTRAEGNTKLLQLAAILDTADALHAERGEPGYYQDYYIHDCGTPACALGHWAAANPDTWAIVVGGPVMRVAANRTHLTSIEEAELEFCLTEEESADLFDVEGCGDAKTAAEAAAYIRAFVARREREGY